MRLDRQLNLGGLKVIFAMRAIAERFVGRATTATQGYGDLGLASSGARLAPFKTEEIIHRLIFQYPS